MEEILKDIGVHLLLSLAGLLIYSLIAVSRYLKTFSMKKFWNDNRPFWIWAFSLQCIFASLITFIPESGDSIKTLTGVDLSQPMAFLTSGLGLAKLANWATGKTVSENKMIGNTQKK